MLPVSYMNHYAAAAGCQAVLEALGTAGQGAGAALAASLMLNWLHTVPVVPHEVCLSTVTCLVEHRMNLACLIM